MTGQHYDSDLQMFVQIPQPINLNRLTFLRWLAEHGLLEHEIAGPVSGPIVQTEIERLAQQSPEYTGKAA